MQVIANVHQSCSSSTVLATATKTNAKLNTSQLATQMDAKWSKPEVS